MRTDNEHPDSEMVEQKATSEKRRRMLKCMATAAPMIATLPSGRALAMGSTSQCVLSSQQTSRDNPDTITGSTRDSLPPADRDKWVRVKALEWTLNTGTETVYIYKIDGTWYDRATGEALDPQPTTKPIACTEVTDPSQLPCFVAERDVYVVALWLPERSSEIDFDDPTGVHPAGPPFGPWPINAINENGNIAITGTCLCSVDANYGGDEYC
jgi:hypothetical protein